jgi:hypothetical protein
MDSRRRPDLLGRKRRRVLLVAPTPLTRSALEPRLAEIAQVRSVPFPGDAFDAAAEGEHDVVLVDVTYLDESLVRPLIARRFAGTDATVVFFEPVGATAVDDLVALAAGRRLRLVEPR